MSVNFNIERWLMNESRTACGLCLEQERKINKDERSTVLQDGDIQGLRKTQTGTQKDSDRERLTGTQKHRETGTQRDKVRQGDRETDWYW